MNPSALRSSRIWLPAALAQFIVAIPALGQSSAPYPLGEIVVSAERPVSEAASTVRTISQAEIEALGARNLDEALRLVPGLIVRHGADGTPRVDMRGFRTRQVTLLLNGIPFNATDDGQFDPGLIPVEEIAAIKVTGGTGSVLYGQGGLGGVINVITPGGGGPSHASLRAEARQTGSQLARGTVSTGHGRLSFFASGSVLHSNLYPSWNASPTLEPVSPVRRINSDRERTNGFLQAGYELGHRGRLGLTLNSVTGYQGKPPSIVDDPADPFANRVVYDRIGRLTGFAAQVGGSYDFSPGWGVRAWAFRNLQRDTTTRYADATLDPATVLAAAGTSRDFTRTVLAGGGAQIRLGIVPLGRLTLGLNAEHDGWQQESQAATSGGGGGGGGGGGSGSVTIQNTATSETLAHYGVALEYQIHPVPRLGLVAGALHGWLASGGVRQEANGYSLGAAYQLSRNDRLRADVAHRFRFPTLRQLYDRSFGNPALRAEEAGLYELGAEHRVGRAGFLGLTLFQTDARDFIERLGSGGYANAERYRFRGVELTGTIQPVRRGILRVSYAFLDADNQSAGAGGATLQYRPRHRVTALARYSAPWGSAAALDLEYVAGEVYLPRRGSFAARNLPDFAVVGIRVEQRIRRVLGIYGGVNNLLDQAYEEAYGFPASRRTAYLGLDARI